MKKTKYYVVVNYKGYEGIYRADHLQVSIKELLPTEHQNSSMIWAVMNPEEAALLYVYGQYRYQYKPDIQPNFDISIRPYRNWSEKKVIQTLQEIGSKKKVEVSGNQSNLYLSSQKHSLSAYKEWISRIKRWWHKRHVIQAPIQITTEQEEVDANQLPILSNIATYVTTDGLVDSKHHVAVAGVLIQHQTGLIEQIAEIKENNRLGSHDIEILAIINGLRCIPKSQYNQPVVVLTDIKTIVFEWNSFVLENKYLEGELTGPTRELVQLANHFSKLRFVKVISHQDPLNLFVHNKINRIQDEYVARITDQE